MKIKFSGILSSIFLIFLAHSASSENSNFELSLKLLKNGEIEQFEEISKDNLAALLERDEIGVTLLERVVFTIDDDYSLRGYPEVAMSVIDEDFQVNQDYKETLIKRILYAIRSIDKDKARVDLNEDMKSDLDRSDFVDLLYHVILTSGGGQPALSDELAVFSIFHICDKEHYSLTDTEKADTKAITLINRAISDTERFMLEVYAEAYTLDTNCIHSFTKDY
ncbi:MAG: hypothetical protein ACTHOO_12690 [Alcanivorax sp.]